MAKSSRRDRKRNASSSGRSSSSANKPKSKHQPQSEFLVEKIVGHSTSRGVTLYRTRWQGFSSAEDTWEPSSNIASTGHLDRYLRRENAKKLNRKTPGVCLIEYEDGEREMVDLQREKFRAHLPDVEDEDRDDSTVNGDDDINDFAMIEEGNYIEIDWPHADIFFPCKILSWTPLPERKRRGSTASLGSLEIELQRKRKNRDATAKKGKPEHDQRDKESSSKKRAKKEAKKKKKKRSKSLADESTVKASKSKSASSVEESQGKADAKKSKLNDDKPSRTSYQSDDSNRDSELPVENMENELFSDVSYERAPVKRSGHGIPLFKEPEDDCPGNRELTESEESGDEDDAYMADPYQTTHKLSFEEQWMLRLQRTKELTERGM
mmetsp:Transcript_32481/g.77590  ORF Transcript_32481/g.77590 Transcript_32481/m.77590 type:complete len:380 (+) Transcript_32481:119-1258(+)